VRNARDFDMLRAQKKKKGTKVRLASGGRHAWRGRAKGGKRLSVEYGDGKGKKGPEGPVDLARKPKRPVGNNDSAWFGSGKERQQGRRRNTNKSSPREGGAWGLYSARKR